jgi:hypothetical protein
MEIGILNINDASLFSYDSPRLKDANKYIEAFMKEWYRDDPGLYYESLDYCKSGLCTSS